MFSKQDHSLGLPLATHQTAQSNLGPRGVEPNAPRALHSEQPVAFRRPKIVFDTQVISNVCTGVISRSEWDAVLKRMSRRCRYMISANTLYELLVGVANGDEGHFTENQNRIRILCEPPKRQFLPLVGDFVRSTVFRLQPRKLAFQPQRIKLWTDVLLTAETKQELLHGVTLSRLGHSDKRYRFDLSLLAQQVEDGKHRHSGRLEELRQGKLRASTPEKWIQAVLRETGVPITPANTARLLAAVDAALHYDLSLYDMAKNHSYDFSQHNSDWIDGQQLLYLADPFIKFITSDRRIKVRTQRSTQVDRILNFEELKAMINVN
jgi:hypothetical protein